MKSNIEAMMEHRTVAVKLLAACAGSWGSSNISHTIKDLDKIIEKELAKQSSSTHRERMFFQKIMNEKRK